MKIVKTGLKGLDWSIGGGFNKPSIVLVSGVAGTGKTTLVMNAAFNMAARKMKVLYISTLSEPPAMILNYMSNYGFFNQSIIDSGLITIVQLKLENKNYDPFNNILEKIEDINPDVVIIDPITPILPKGEEHRAEIFNFYTMMKGWNVLTIITHELFDAALKSDLNSYLADTVIQLDVRKVRDYTRNFMSIIKSRGGAHYNSSIVYDISSSGITFYPYPMLLNVKKKKKSPMTRKQISTGSKDLDTLLDGGIFEASNTLLVGPVGVGKTELIYFISNNLIESGKKVGFITIFTSPLKYIVRMEGMNIDALSHYKNRKLNILSVKDYEIGCDTLLFRIKEWVIKNKIDIVIGLDAKWLLRNQKMENIEFLSKVVMLLKTLETTNIFVLDEKYDIQENQMSGLGRLIDYQIVMDFVESAGVLKKDIVVMKSPGCRPEIKVMRINQTSTSLKLENPGNGSRNTGDTPSRRAKDLFSPR